MVVFKWWVEKEKCIKEVLVLLERERRKMGYCGVIGVYFKEEVVNSINC